MGESVILLPRPVSDDDRIADDVAIGAVIEHAVRHAAPRYLEAVPEAIPEAVPSAPVRAAHANPTRLRALSTLAADAVALVLAALVAGWLSIALAQAPPVQRLFSAFDTDVRGGALTLVLLTPYWLVALWAFGLYRAPGRAIGGASLIDAFGGLTALTSAAWVLFVAMALVEGPQAPLAALVAFWAVAIWLVPLARWVIRLTVWSRTALEERVLVIGAGEVGQGLAVKIAKHPEYRIRLVGFLDDGEPRSNGSGPASEPLLGGLRDLRKVIVEQRVDRVIVAFAASRHKDFLRVVRACADHRVQVNIVPRLFEVVSSRALVDDVEGIPLLDVGNVELGAFNMAAKRVFDLVVGLPALILMLPVLLALAVIVRLDSPGPVFYRQERMGRGGKTFRIFKFRTMYDGAEKLRLDLAERNDYSGPMFKMKEDPRITRVGAWFRKLSLDELPQIFNVLKGEMSLVGPRPLWVDEAKQCHGWTKKRVDITPGITGLWQVLGRNDIPFDEMVKLDYMYVTGWSLSWDVKLLLKTVPTVLGKRGAY